MAHYHIEILIYHFPDFLPAQVFPGRKILRFSPRPKTPYIGRKILQFSLGLTDSRISRKILQFSLGLTDSKIDNTIGREIPNLPPSPMGAYIGKNSFPLTVEKFCHFSYGPFGPWKKSPDFLFGPPAQKSEGIPPGLLLALKAPLICMKISRFSLGPLAQNSRKIPSFTFGPYGPFDLQN